MEPERIENWDKFSRHMRKYIQECTIDKYSTDNAKTDLMSITGNPLICIWNVLKYTFRIWNGRMKEHDIEKIVHYAEMAWTMSNGQIIKRDETLQFKPRIVKQKAVGEM